VSMTLVSLFGIGIWFVILHFRRSGTAERLRLAAAALLSLLLAAATTDTVRIGTVMGWPCLLVCADSWARSGEPLFPGVEARTARWLSIAFWLLWFVKLG
jgi:hypothetical protein